VSEGTAGTPCWASDCEKQSQAVERGVFIELEVPEDYLLLRHSLRLVQKERFRYTALYSRS
jgi:hypothetical protein